MVNAGTPGIRARDVYRVPIIIAPSQNLAGASGALIPEGHHVIGIACDHANWADVSIQIYDGVGWRDCRELNSGAAFSPRNQAPPYFANFPIISDGVIVRVYNANVGVTNNITYYYIDRT